MKNMHRCIKYKSTLKEDQYSTNRTVFEAEFNDFSLNSNIKESGQKEESQVSKLTRANFFLARDLTQAANKEFWDLKKELKPNLKREKGELDLCLFVCLIR